MRIKNNNRTIVCVYVDGRVETVFSEKPTSIYTAIKLGLIEGVMEQHVRNLVNHLEPGRYEVTLTKLNWFKRSAKIDLKPV